MKAALSVPLLVRFAEAPSIASEPSSKLDGLPGGYVIPLEQVSPRYCHGFMYSLDQE